MQLLRLNLASGVDDRFFRQGHHRWLDRVYIPCDGIPVSSFPLPTLPCGLFSGKAPESELAIGGFVPEKKVAGNAATPDTEVPEISGNELRQELWG